MALGLLLFSSTGHDDSHITYWVALALQRFGKLVNYNGERVEQSSSLAHVVLLALLGLVTRAPMPTLGPLTSIGFGALAVGLTAKVARLVTPARGAELLAATAVCFVYWGFGGLESTLFAAAALWLVLGGTRYLEAPSRKTLGWAAAAAALFLTTRPETPLVLACALALTLAHAFHRRTGVRAVLVLAGVAALEAGLVFAFRRAYFGSFFPNPVYTKATTVEVAAGLRYLKDNLFPWGLGLAVAFAAGLFALGRAALDQARFAAVLTLGLALGYLGFVVCTGGDWMAGGRFLAHVLPLACVIAVAGVGRFLANERARIAAVAVLTAANLYGTLAFADHGSTGRPLWTTKALRAQLDARIGDRGYGFFELSNKVHLRDTTVSAWLTDVVGAIRAKHPDRTLTLMASQAGMVPYHLFEKHYGAVRFLDMCSLATTDFLRCLPKAMLQKRPVGMQLHFDRYFKDEAEVDKRCGTRRPDLVFGLGRRGIEAVLEKHGYTLVARQWGSIDNEATAGHLRTPLEADEFVAVDSQLLQGVDYQRPAPFAWDVR